MTTVTPATDPALPLGADPENIDNWETVDGVTSRLVWSIPDPRPLEFSCDVRVVVSQCPDGSIITEKPTDDPLVYLDGQDLSLSEARVLAIALIDAVQLVEMWVAR